MTTARHGLTADVLEAEPLAGRVLRIPLSVTGMPTKELITQ